MTTTQHDIEDLGVGTGRTLRHELAAVAGALAARYPALPRAEVHEIVDDVYERLHATARLHAHLIPLTLNRARAEVQRRLGQRGAEGAR